MRYEIKSVNSGRFPAPQHVIMVHKGNPRTLYFVPYGSNVGYSLDNREAQIVDVKHLEPWAGEIALVQERV